MRIAMISEHASPLAAIGGVDAGGQNLHVAELSAALYRAGHEVTVYTRRDCADLPERVASGDGYDVVHVPAGPPQVVAKDDLLPYMRPFGRWLAAHWRSHGTPPDLVHAHYWMSGLAGLEATSRVRVPIVQTYHALGVVKRRHQGEADSSPDLRIPVEIQLGHAAHRVVAQCTDEVAELAAMGVPEHRISVVPSGVDIGRFCPAGEVAPRRPGLFRILSVGRMVPRKGYEDLIRAMTEVANAELVLIGGPPDGMATDPEVRRLGSLAAELGVADRVRLVGAVERALMPAWYRSADVLACTPWYEPFGLTPLEAMACGIPVVTYAVGGLQESVVHGRTGMHVEPGDIRGLAAALRELLGDDDARRRLGQTALSRVRANFAWPTVATRLSKVYEEVVVGHAELAGVLR